MRHLRHLSDRWHDIRAHRMAGLHHMGMVGGGGDSYEAEVGAACGAGGRSQVDLMKQLLWKALGTGVAQGRQAGIAPRVPAGSAPCPPASARLFVLLPFLFPSLFPFFFPLLFPFFFLLFFLFFFLSFFLFFFLFSFSCLLCFSLSFFNTSEAVSAFFLASLARAAFCSEAASPLRRLLPVHYPPVHAHPSLFSVAAAQHRFSSVQAQPFSAFLVHPCASGPDEHLPACAPSPVFVVPVSNLARPSLSAEPVFCRLRYAAWAQLQPLSGFHMTKVLPQPQHVSVSFVEDHPETYQTDIAYNGSRMQNTTTDQDTGSSSTLSGRPLLQHSQ